MKYRLKLIQSTAMLRIVIDPNVSRTIGRGADSPIEYLKLDLFRCFGSSSAKTRFLGRKA